MKMKLFIVFLATVSCCLAAQTATIPAVPFEQSLPESVDGYSAASRIINGQVAAANQFPHQVSLRISSDDGASICGGSIISATWVLSAAHCTSNARQFVLRFGSLNMNSGGISQTTFRAINHPQFNPINLNNDISLLPLSSPLSFNAAVRAVRLPTRAQAEATFLGQVATVSGWGAIANGGDAQELLRWTNVRIIANAECARTFGDGAVVGHVVCTEGAQGHQGVCGGDSGGPLVLQEGGETTQVGVVAFGASAFLGGCQGGRPSGYMRTASFLPWINQHTGIPIRG